MAAAHAIVISYGTCVAGPALPTDYRTRLVPGARYPAGYVELRVRTLVVRGAHSTQVSPMTHQEHSVGDSSASEERL